MSYDSKKWAGTIVTLSLSARHVAQRSRVHGVSVEISHKHILYTARLRAGGGQLRVEVDALAL